MIMSEGNEERRLAQVLFFRCKAFASDADVASACYILNIYRERKGHKCRLSSV